MLDEDKDGRLSEEEFMEYYQQRSLEFDKVHTLIQLPLYLPSSLEMLYLFIIDDKLMCHCRMIRQLRIGGGENFKNMLIAIKMA